MPQQIDVPGMGVVEFPDGMSEADIVKAIKANQPASSPVMDFVRSIPRGLLSGLSAAISASGQSAQAEMGEPITVPSGGIGTRIMERNVTGELPQPSGRAGQYGATVGEFLGNPTSYVGPGGMALKVGSTIASGLGSEAA